MSGIGCCCADAVTGTPAQIAVNSAIAASIKRELGMFF
jgi:hypothetical protein